jgi:hypothetical protein
MKSCFLLLLIPFRFRLLRVQVSVLAGSLPWRSLIVTWRYKVLVCLPCLFCIS